MKTSGHVVMMLVLSAFLVVAAAFPAPGAAGDPPVTVTIEGGSFLPETVAVKAGGEVVWKNRDSAAHTVTADNGSFDSGSLGQGDEFKYTPSLPGTITYSCDNHAWMKGKIEVR